MNMSPEKIVHRAISEHLGVEAGAIRSRARLTHDLGLLPLDIVLITLRIEDHEGVGLPMDRLASVHTVGQLVEYVRRAYAHMTLPTHVLARLRWRYRRAGRRPIVRRFAAA